MGKSLDGRRWTIQSSAPYIAGMVALWLKLATRGYSQKDMRCMLGKLAWADRPAREKGPRTSGAMAWMMWGPQNARYTPPKVLRGRAETLASVMGPWSARRTTAADDIDMYVDAAEYGDTYLVGLWSREAGARIWECPKAVRNQQAAELQAVERAVKMAAYRRRQQVHLGADNLAAIWAALKRKTKIHRRDRATTVRRIQQTLRESGIVLKLAMYRQSGTRQTPSPKFLSGGQPSGRLWKPGHASWPCALFCTHRALLWGRHPTEAWEELYMDCPEMFNSTRRIENWLSCRAGEGRNHKTYDNQKKSQVNNHFGTQWGWGCKLIS